MKNYIIFIGVLLSLVLPLSAQDKVIEKASTKWLDSDSFVHSGGFELDGKQFRYHLKMSDFANSPKWEPSFGEPPLSIGNVQKIASEELKLLVDNPEQWSVWNIELTKLPGVTDAWYYTVKFVYAKYDKPRDSYYAIIKLDGTPIRGKLIPQEKDSPRQ